MAPEALALHEKVRVGRMAFLFQGAERHPEERPEFARRGPGLKPGTSPP